jgi:hypothetical protein
MQGLQFLHTHPFLSPYACRSSTRQLVYKHPVRQEEEEKEAATDESVFL